MPKGTFRAKVDATGHGQIFIDDKEISDMVSGFVIKADVKRVSTVVIRLIGVDLDLEIEDDPEVTRGDCPVCGEPLRANGQCLNVLAHAALEREPQP